MKKLYISIPYIILTVFIGTIIFFRVQFENDPNRITIPTAFELEEITYNDNVLPSLPTRVDINKGELFTIETVLPDSFENEQHVLFRTSLQNITVSIDGDVIYDMTYDEESNYASMWHTIRIPANSDGSTLTVELQSPFSAMTGVVNPVYYGELGSLSRHIFMEYGFRLIIGILTLMIGFVLLILTRFVYKNGNHNYIYLGLFSILLGTWIVSESRMLQLFTDNIAVLGSLSYLSLVLLPIPIFLYLSFHIQKVYARIFIVFTFIFISYTPMIVIFNLIDFLEYFESVILTQILLGISVILVFYVLVIEKYKYKNKAIDEMFLYLSIIGVFGLFELITFFSENFDFTSTFMVIGVLIVMILIILNYIRFLISRFKSSYEKDFYQFLAYHDPITGAQNRLAFEQELDEMYAGDDNLSSLRLVYYDLDGLKKINDEYGHLEGDKAILNAYRIINNSFGKYGQVYRIGGDEFACITTSLEEAEYLETLSYLNQLIEEVNLANVYHFGLATGNAVYLKSDQEPSDLHHRADISMYEDKQNK